MDGEGTVPSRAPRGARRGHRPRAITPAGQTPERRAARGAADPAAAAEDCVCCACLLSAHLISRLPAGTEFLCWILGSALVKGSNYFRALSISICCPYLQRPGLRWLEFQVINVAVTSLLGVLSLLAVPPPPPFSSSSSEPARQAGRDKGLSSTWAVLPVSRAAAACLGSPHAAGFMGSRLDAAGCIAEV